MTAFVSSSSFIAEVTAFNTFHNFLGEGDSKGTVDAMDVVDLDRLFPEEDFPYTSDFAIPFMFNSIDEEYEEHERQVAQHKRQAQRQAQAEHRLYRTDDANHANGLTSFGDLESTHRDHEKEERVIGEEDDGSTVAAAQNWSPETISRPEEVDEDSRTKSFYFRILGPDGSSPYVYENVSEVIIDPETGEAEEVVVYITDPALMPSRSRGDERENGWGSGNHWVENRIESPPNRTTSGIRRLRRRSSGKATAAAPFDFSKLGFTNWPQKPTGPTLESPQKDTGSAPASSSYGSGYGTSAMSAYQTGTDGYGYARENKEARSSGSVSSAYETGATNASGKESVGAAKGPEPEGRGYGHGGYGGGHIKKKKGGKFGKGKDNFHCKYAKETLYVSKVGYGGKKKCYYTYKTDCTFKYAKGKGIGYKKECSEFSTTKCRKTFFTTFKTQCSTGYKKVCSDSYGKKTKWVYKEHCWTLYEKVCKGYGYHKKCFPVPKQRCKQIPVKVGKKVGKTKCKSVPTKKCSDVPVYVPKKECKHFPKTVCLKDPVQIKKTIPKKVCFSVPKKKCNKIPVQFLKHVPKTVSKKVCSSTKYHGKVSVHKGGGYGGGKKHHGGGGYHRSTEDGAVVQSRQEEIPLGGKAANGTDTAEQSTPYYPTTAAKSSEEEKKPTGSDYTYNSYY